MELVKSDPQQGGTLVSAIATLVNAYTVKPENKLIAAEVEILNSADTAQGGSYFDIAIRPPATGNFAVFVYCAIKAGGDADATDPNLSLSAVIKQLYTRVGVTAAFGAVSLNSQFEDPCDTCSVSLCPAVLLDQLATTAAPAASDRGLQPGGSGGQASTGGSSGSNNTGLIIAICVVLVVCIALLAAFVVRRRFNQMSRNPAAMAAVKNTREGTVAFENPLCRMQPAFCC